MVFSNAVFLFLFLPITLLLYYSPFCKTIKHKNIWLLIASLGFYAWGEPVYVLLMILSVCINWILGKCVFQYQQTVRGKIIVAISCIFNLGLLFVFKYLAWLLKEFCRMPQDSLLSSLALPIGISFYTFQALSYVIDIYRGNGTAQKNVLNVGLYIAFFPQLIAGPIVRYSTIAEALIRRTHSFENFAEGVWRFTIGLSKKLLLANHLAVVASVAFARDAGERSVLLAWSGALAFMLQIYFDFSGYSDMAIGLGMMFGFHFSENFDYPYTSKSVTEFWRRWHISLGTWFRDYVYIPFGGNRVKKWRHIFNLLVVWMLTGIWHGANWTFVIWGGVQFVFILLEKYGKIIKNERAKSIVGHFTTYLIILFGWVIFNAESVHAAVLYYASMFHLNNNSWVDIYGLYWVNQYKIFLISGVILSLPVLRLIPKLFKTKSLKKGWNVVQIFMMCALLVIDICYAIGGGYNPFIYFNF